MADATPESKSKADTWLSRTRTVFEIIGIPVAAYWAFTHFEQAEAPSLKIRSDIKSELVWFDSTDTGECFGKLDFTLKNIGKVNFEVDQVVLRAYVTEGKPRPSAVSYFPPSALIGEQATEEQVIADQLVGEYRPDQSSHEDFVFRFKRQPGMFALIQLTAPVKPTKHEAEPKPIVEYRWDFVCGELTPKAAQGSASSLRP